MATFLDVQPTVENRWRALVLFGRNVASYKFALGSVLLGLADRDDDRVPLEEIALPYAQAICGHLKSAPKQATSATSRFLSECRAFNSGDITEDQLREATVRLGFVNVIEAFHRLGPSDLEHRFFLDERVVSKSLRLTDNLRALAQGHRPQDLALENQARWRLVETAWELGVNRCLIEYAGEAEGLTVRRQDRRVTVTSCRSALNGYQKGHCFYCFRPISIETLGFVPDVDHFFPWRLRAELGLNLDGVWNLVLACAVCNRGAAGKFDLIPALPLLARLHERNEFLITSHHPLRETLISQTGGMPGDRKAFLTATYGRAINSRVARWSPRETEAPVF